MNNMKKTYTTGLCLIIVGIAGIIFDTITLYMASTDMLTWGFQFVSLIIFGGITYGGFCIFTESQTETIVRNKTLHEIDVFGAWLRNLHSKYESEAACNPVGENRAKRDILQKVIRKLDNMPW